MKNATHELATTPPIPANEQERRIIERKIAEIDAIASELPGVVIILNTRTQSVEYMSKRGQETLGVTQEELREMGTNYYKRFFNPEDSADYVPKIFGLMERNDQDELITFFQQVRPSEQYDWSWYFSSVKILLRDEDHKPLLCITMAYPIDPLHHITAKVSRLLEENNFLRKNYSNFARLTKRECEILKLLAMGKTSPEIAGELFISVATAETHRRNIKQKLNASTLFDLSQYARAFDLI